MIETKRNMYTTEDCFLPEPIPVSVPVADSLEKASTGRDSAPPSKRGISADLGADRESVVLRSPSEASTGRDSPPPNKRGTSADLGAVRESVVLRSSSEASTGRDSAPPSKRGTSADLGADRESVVLRSPSEVAWKLLRRDRPPLFSGVSDDEYAKISGGARVKQFARSEMLYLEGNSVRQVILLTSGLVKITKIGMSGSEVILRLGSPGDVLGAGDPFSNGLHGTTAQAFRLCEGLVWEAAVFKDFMERFPVLHQNMAKILGRHLLELEDRFREVATERVGQRVARQVVRLAEQIGKPIPVGVEIGLSREELAQMTGTTLYTVSRLFSTWEASGILKPRREAVVICKMESLRSLSKENAGDALAG